MKKRIIVTKYDEPRVLFLEIGDSLEDGVVVDVIRQWYPEGYFVKSIYYVDVKA